MADVGHPRKRTLECAAHRTSPSPQAPKPPGPHDAILLYQGADREAWLLERERKEGSVTLYTSMAPTEAGPLLKEFEKKYGIKTELWLSFCLDTTPRLAGINTRV